MKDIVRQDHIHFLVHAVTFQAKKEIQYFLWMGAEENTFTSILLMTNRRSFHAHLLLLSARDMYSVGIAKTHQLYMKDTLELPLARRCCQVQDKRVVCLLSVLTGRITYYILDPRIGLKFIRINTKVSLISSLKVFRPDITWSFDRTLD